MTEPRDDEERLQRSKETLEWSKEGLAHEQRRRPRVVSLSGSLKRFKTENHFSDKLKGLFDGS